MVGSYQDAPLSTCHYCTFWSVRQPNLPSKVTRAPRVPKTSKGILWYKQLFSSINGNTENGPQLSPVHGAPLIPDKPSKTEVEIPPVHEAPEKTVDKQDNCELSAQINTQTTEILCNGEDVQDALTGEIEAEGDATHSAMLQDHVYCLVVSLPCLVFSTSSILQRTFLD
ncbi:hypothetical protein E2C01_066888 [Portunus trituberculatus]|uniref:Uncharacterized protein n=1 Tax=Portunus trituberculatus TaxID=210409 RepID=A0A5B7HRY5_PORTR|nr:hypothetical protein [Portunus trituberculatus]